MREERCEKGEREGRCKKDTCGKGERRPLSTLSLLNLHIVAEPAQPPHRRCRRPASQAAPRPSQADSRFALVGVGRHLGVCSGPWGLMGFPWCLHTAPRWADPPSGELDTFTAIENTAIIIISPSSSIASKQASKQARKQASNRLEVWQGLAGTLEEPGGSGRNFGGAQEELGSAWSVHILTALVHQVGPL